MKFLKKAISILLLVALLCPMLASCGKNLGTPIMKLGDAYVTENMLEFWLSRYKAYFVEYYMNGTDNKAFWNELVPDSDKTWNETFTAFIVDNAKTYVASLYLFDELGLSLSDSVVKEIDDEIQELIDGQADGNKNEFNEILSQYGANIDILREIYIMEAKIDFLQKYLYGENGIEKISTSAKDKYYEDNYIRFKHIFLYTGRRPTVDDKGEYVYDDKGYVKYRTMTSEEDAAAEDMAQKIFEGLTTGGLSEEKQLTEFEDLLDIYCEDIAAADEYPNGFYLTESSSYVKEVLDAVCEMKVGEIRIVKSSVGIHVIRRYELDEKGYSAKENTDFFTDFESSIIAKTFNARLEEYKKLIEVDEERVATYNLKDANANYSY